MEALFIFVLLLLLLFLRIPIYLSLYLGGLLGFIIFTGMDLTFVAQTFLLKLQNFSLISIPFFILLGNLMLKGKSAKRLVDLAVSLVSRLPSGLSITGIVSSAVFGAISGSSISTLVTIGSILLPDIEKQKYPKELGIGLLASSSVLGIIVPPSIIMIVCALTAGESVIRLFAAGYLPSLLIVLCLSAYAIIASSRTQNKVTQKEKSNHESFIRLLKNASLPILLIIIIFAGIYSGAFTVTEASVVSCVLALIIELIIYRSFGMKDFISILSNTFVLSGALVITVSGAGVISEYITMREIPQNIMSIAMKYIPNKYIFLLFVDILLLLICTFIDPIGAIMILVPIVIPISNVFGIDPTHMCLIITVALGIGYLTPPLGLLIYTGCAISGRDFIYIVKAIIPSLVILIITLVIIMYVPTISTYVPNMLLGPRK